MANGVQPNPAETEALLRLTLTHGLGPVLIARLLERFETAHAVCEAGPTRLAQVKGLSLERARQVVLDMGEVNTDAELSLAAEHGVQLLPRFSPEYPSLLATIPDPPPLLYVRGRLSPDDDLYSVAIVGSRRCSAYGRDQAARFATSLAQSGLTIVSGGARGIDTEAHRGALRAGGRTIVVVGNGLCHTYPRENAGLYDSVVEQGGAIVSEFPMDFGPAPENFPRRNRIISGLSLGTLVIEAPKHSGALITARLACEEHNREVMAVPGRVDTETSAGCHRMIRENWARLVTNAREVLEALDESAPLVRGARDLSASEVGINQGSGPGADTGLFDRPSEHALSPTQNKILSALDSEPVSLDELAARTGIEISQLQADITMLQIRGLIARSPSQTLTRTHTA